MPPRPRKARRATTSNDDEGVRKVLRTATSDDDEGVLYTVKVAVGTYCLSTDVSFVWV